MILFLVEFLFLALILPAIPLLCAWGSKAGIIKTLLAGLLSLGILALLIRGVVVIFGMGEGNTSLPIQFGEVLATIFVIWTFFLVQAAYDRKSSKGQRDQDGDETDGKD